MTIEQLIYQQLNEVKSIKALQMLKIVHENREPDGWCKFGYSDFMKIGIPPESTRRTLKLLQEKKLIEIQDQERKKDTRGQLSHQYRVILENQVKNGDKKAGKGIKMAKKS